MRRAGNINIQQPITKARSVCDADAEQLAGSACLFFSSSNWPLVVCFGYDADNATGCPLALNGRSARMT